MPSSSLKTATNYNNVAGAGTDWVSQTAMLTPAGTTDYLACDTLGFAIPSGATIVGIMVEFERYKSFGTGTVRDYEVKLWQPTVGLTASKADTGTNWPGTITTSSSYGGAADVWGASWTYSQINDSAFGVYIKANETGGTGNATAVIGDAFVTVYYEVAADPWAAWIASIMSSLIAGTQVATGNASGGIGIHTGRSRSRHTPIGY